ncbi:MAG: VWA domain-containing protein [Bacteroidota bacterium]|nr:VWA domain-containing protein [Bacteroidota bacterium]
MLHFQYIEYLIALAALPVIFVLYILVVKWKKNTAKKIGDPALVKELTAQYSSKRFLTKFILFILAFALCAFAVAGLVKPDGTQKINRKGSDIMIALDVSKSMLAQDIKPNRLERAKQVISRIIDNSPDDKIGLVIFAGRAYLQMPMTIDHSAAKMYLASASPNDVPTQGTVISDALKMCYSAFNPKEKTYKSVLLLSDGEDHDEDAINVTKQLAKEGIMVNTIGIGSPQGAPIPDPATGQYKTDAQGQMVISKLNQEELSDIAKAGNGIYQLYTNTEEVAGNIKKRLAGMGKQTSLSDSSYVSFEQYFQYILAAAFILLLLEFFMAEKKRMKIKNIVTVLFLLVISNTSYSQKAKSAIINGNKAYEKNDFKSAEKEYRDALKSSEKNVIANYNLGNALYRNNNAGEAAKSYDNAVQNASDNTIKQQAFYNEGVAYQKEKKLPESINAYKNALLLNPNDEDARQNLERALKEQKQQQKQQQNKKDDKDNKDKKQQPKNQKNNNQPQQNKGEPKPQPSKMSKQDAEEKLKSLLENEKALQDRLHKMRGSATPVSPEKDW